MNLLYFWVALGGALGSVARYALSTAFPHIAFPYATLFINLVACFILGFSVGWGEKSESIKMALEVGFCGGFSTFSSFSKEVFLLFQQQQIWAAFAYVVMSNLLGFAAFALAYWLAWGCNAK